MGSETGRTVRLGPAGERTRGEGEGGSPPLGARGEEEESSSGQVKREVTRRHYLLQFRGCQVDPSPGWTRCSLPCRVSFVCAQEGRRDEFKGFIKGGLFIVQGTFKVQRTQRTQRQVTIANYRSRACRPAWSGAGLFIIDHLNASSDTLSLSGIPFADLQELNLNGKEKVE